MQSVMATPVDQVPPGFKTVRDIAVEIRLSASHTYKFVAALMEAGHAERKKFRIKMPNGSVKNVPHYKLK